MVNLTELTAEKDIDIGLFEKVVHRVVLQNPNLRYQKIFVSKKDRSFPIERPFFVERLSIFRPSIFKPRYLRSILREKEGKNEETNLTERFEMSIYEDPIGTYFEFIAQEEPWSDLDCKLIYFICSSVFPIKPIEFSK